MNVKKTLNNMPRLVFWRIDDALVMIIPFALGILFGSILMVFGSFIGAYFYRKLRKRNGNINIKAWIYWIFGPGYSNIPSHIRRIRR
jgi:type IV conjugative transfer system protein TraL